LPPAGEGQIFPHVPQLVTDDFTSTQSLSQTVSGHVATQPPATQNGVVVGQGLSHRPQWARLVRGSVSHPSSSTPLQSRKGWLQESAHAPPRHVLAAFAGPAQGRQSRATVHPYEGSSGATQTLPHVKVAQPVLSGVVGASRSLPMPESKASP
jgi:hypothetical protein